jgi:GTP-binding protein
VLKISKKFGMHELDLQTAFAGDIVSIAGFAGGTVGHTLNNVGQTHVIPAIPIDPPTLSLNVTYNDSPYKGNDGDKLTISQIKERLVRESQDDVALRVEAGDATLDTVTVSGRGDLHLGVLLEKMRREGYEMAVSPPQILTRVCEKTGNLLEPFESVEIDVDLIHVANIVENLTNRKGVLLNAVEQSDGRQLLTFRVPTRGLLGFRTYLTAETRGTA